MTRTICAEADPVRTQKRRRLLAADLVRRCELVRCPLAFFERHIGMRKADAKEKGDHAGDRLELTDLDVVVGRPRTGGDEKLFHPVVRDNTHDPDPVIAGAFLMCRLLAQDFSAIAAFHELAEPGFRNHIWCFDVPTHGPAHAFSKGATSGHSYLKPRVTIVYYQPQDVISCFSCSLVTQTLVTASVCDQGDNRFEKPKVDMPAPIASYGPSNLRSRAGFGGILLRPGPSFRAKRFAGSAGLCGHHPWRFRRLHPGYPELFPLPRQRTRPRVRRSAGSQRGLWPISAIGRGLMGSLGSIRLAARGNQTPITPSNIYFLDNRFHPLATSQKVCDAWQRQSEARDRWHFARHWSTPASRRASVRRTWRSSSSAINPSWRALKAASAGSTSSSWSSLRAPSALTPSRFWRSSKPPRSPTTGFEQFH